MVESAGVPTGIVASRPSSSRSTIRSLRTSSTETSGYFFMKRTAAGARLYDPKATEVATRILPRGAFGNDPATVGIGIGSAGPAEPKDTRANIRETEQFVVNLVPFSLAQEMRVTSIAFPRGVEEPAEAGLSLAASERVAIPRIAQAPVSMECTFMQEIALGSFGVVLGKILMVHVSDEAVIDAGRQYVDANKLDLIGRMEGAWYTTTRDRFEMPRSRSATGTMRGS